jgi:RNA recognition motif-containing protein
MMVAFGAAGEVLGAIQMRNNQACIAYSTAQEAQDAIAQFNGGDFNGSTLEVDVWTRKPKGAGKEATKSGSFGKGAFAAGKVGFGAKGSSKGGVLSSFGSKGATSFKGKAASSLPFSAGKGATFAKGATFGNGATFGKAAVSGKGKGKSDAQALLKQVDSAQKVWVGGLPEGLSREDMITAFSSAGKVLDAANFGPQRGNSGCVAYATSREAQNAIKTLNGGDFNGSTIEVDVWSKKDADDGSGKSSGKGKGKFKGKGKGLW